MPHARSHRRARFAALLSVVLAFTGLQMLLLAPAANADGTANTTYPYSQPWTNAGLITTSDDWAGVPAVLGYRGDDITTGVGTDPQTLTGEGTLVLDVNANQTSPDSFTTGGLAEFDGIANPTVALSGSGTADAPYVVFRMNLTGQSNASFAFNARDLDGSIDNSTQQIATQYRVGGSGAFTNLPSGYIADASSGPSIATLVTPVSVNLPAGTDNQAIVDVRVMTTNATGNDEWIGIDDVAVTVAGGPLAGTDPGAKTGTVGSPIASFTMAATGGTGPYTWSDPTTSLPPGVTVTSGGLVSGTPTTAGPYSVVLRVTDSAGSPAQDDVPFTFTVDAPGALAGTDPGAKTGTVGTPISSFTMAATGGTGPYTWSDPTASSRPVSTVASGGLVSGTPTTAGPYSVVLRVTDSAGSPAQDDVPFTFTVSAAAGDQDDRRAPGHRRAVHVRARQRHRAGHRDGDHRGRRHRDPHARVRLDRHALRGNCGFCGFTIQTGGTGGAVDATPGASDAHLRLGRFHLRRQGQHQHGHRPRGLGAA